jgi:hypothetical protein
MTIAHAVNVEAARRGYQLTLQPLLGACGGQRAALLDTEVGVLDRAGPLAAPLGWHCNGCIGPQMGEWGMAITHAVDVEAVRKPRHLKSRCSVPAAG